MNKQLRIPQDTLETQALASDPALSAWVSANAGSGKTHVLAQRVIRLLLKGTDASKILCLTYTRAASANMSNRVFSSLAGWSTATDEVLALEIEKLEGQKPSAVKLRRARQLFARALETPGGLKIQTIHAFCEAILHQFPLEANIAGHFEMLDDQMQEALFSEARRDLLTSVVGDSGSRLAQAFDIVLERSGESGLQSLLQEIIWKRDELASMIASLSKGGSIAPALREEFDFDSHETLETVAGSVWPLPGFSLAQFSEFVTVADEVEAKSILKSIVPEASAAFVESDPIVRLELLRRSFLSGKGEPYAERTFTKKLRERLPDIYERYIETTTEILKQNDRLALMRQIELTDAALVIADDVIQRYEKLKNARGFLDFNDLIQRTVKLLMRADVGQWIQFKLDKGIDHILIDEAQDTSPAQWAIVQQLAEEFFSGASARDGVERTVFAVGDEKQSIYSFQGAEPSSFTDSGLAFKERVPLSGGRFERVKLTRSFRSTEDVLSAVDLVFADPNARRGVTYYDEPIEHKAIRENAPGYVEIWTSLNPVMVEEPDDWTESIDHASAPAVRLAEQISDQIKSWLDENERLEGKGRQLAAGDIMVLVRKRDRFVHALSRALKNRNIPVAGADRLRLTAHIAIKDLMALGRFLIQPHDDLSLAAILKSPLFELNEDDLFALAARREDGATLFSALQEKAVTDPRLATIAATLQDWQDRAAFAPVYEFYAEILAGTDKREGARKRFVSRLGREANDILDEFLSYCLASERSNLTGLETMLSTLEVAAPDIKREMDQSRNEIRIMTVHAAKGLEAPVVFLVDPGSTAVSHVHIPELLPFKMKNRQKGFLWRKGKDVQNSVSQEFENAIKRKAEDEYRRLLYVGMTRAEDRLIVCGYQGARPTKDTWHSMVWAAFAGLDGVEERSSPEVCAPVLRYRVTPLGVVDDIESGPSLQDVGLTPLPQEFSHPLPQMPVLPRPLSPSGASMLIENNYQAVASSRSPVLDASQSPSLALERGNAIHRLLQVLPDMPEGDHEQLIWRYLERVSSDWPQGEAEKAGKTVLSIMHDSRFAPLFTTTSRAEVAIMGKVTLGGVIRAVSGKIDRLAVTDSHVLIVDYKTNRPAPTDITSVPQAYLAQIALYAALIKPIYPGKKISAALLFTETPCLIEISEEKLSSTLADLARS